MSAVRERGSGGAWRGGSWCSPAPFETATGEAGPTYGCGTRWDEPGASGGRLTVSGGLGFGPLAMPLPAYLAAGTFLAGGVGDTHTSGSPAPVVVS